MDGQLTHPTLSVNSLTDLELQTIVARAQTHQCNVILLSIDPVIHHTLDPIGIANTACPIQMTREKADDHVGIVMVQRDTPVCCINNTVADHDTDDDRSVRRFLHNARLIGIDGRVTLNTAKQHMTVVGQCRRIGIEEWCL